MKELLMINWNSYYKKIPAEVKIGKETYTVLWVDEFPKDKKQLGESNHHGTFNTIIIKVNQSTKEVVHTYWHELLHCLSEQYNANLTEKQVLALEKGLKDIIKSDNMFKKEGKNETTNKRIRRNSKRIR